MRIINTKQAGYALSFALALVPFAASADSPIGQIKSETGAVTVGARGGASKPVAIGDHVFQSDTVVTAANGSVGITFDDNSMMSLGPRSRLVLDQFSFNTTTHGGVFNASLKKGTLAVKTGQIVRQTPEAMHVRTQAALLGVRGTEFVVLCGRRALMLRRLPGLMAFCVATLLAGCSHELVVVLPASDGHIGGVVVEDGSQKIVLDKPYAGAEPGSGTVKAVISDEKEVGVIFAGALAARPIPPATYILYFANDSDELVPESRDAFDKIFAEVSRRNAAEIVITGHTDTVGTPEHNDQLSLDRANAVVQSGSAKVSTAHGTKP